MTDEDESTDPGIIAAERAILKFLRGRVEAYPIDQARGIQQRCCLTKELLDVESDFKALLMEARTGAGIGCASYPRGLSKPVTDFSQISLNRCLNQMRVHRRQLLCRCLPPPDGSIPRKIVD